MFFDRSPKFKNNKIPKQQNKQQQQQHENKMQSQKRHNILIQNKTTEQAEKKQNKRTSWNKNKQNRKKKQEPEIEMRNRDSLFNKPKNTRIAVRTVLFIRNWKKQAQKNQTNTNKTHQKTTEEGEHLDHSNKYKEQNKNKLFKKTQQQKQLK